MSASAFICLLSAAIGLSLATGLVLARPRSLPQWSFLAGIVLLGLERYSYFAALDAGSKAEVLSWVRFAGISTALIPSVWLVFSLTFARGNAREFIVKWIPVVVLLVVAPLTAFILMWPTLPREIAWSGLPGLWDLQSGPPVKALNAVMLLGSVLILVNLEWTFRSAVGTARWKVKYALLGIAALFGTRIYSCTQIMLYSAVSTRLIVLDSCAMMLACVLFVVAVVRSRLAHVDIYPSSTVLHKSISVLLAAAYFLIIGVLAWLVKVLGGHQFLPVESMVILFALAGLGVLLLSDKLRESTRRLVTRHFQRPAYDYQKVWSSFTQRTAAMLDGPSFARAVASLLSETFEVLSVTIWLVDDRSGGLTLGASTSLNGRNSGRMALPNDALEALARPGGTLSGPINLDRSKATWCELVRRANPDFFANGGSRHCSALVSGSEVQGLLVLGDRVNGVAFSTEDLELLECLSDQIAATLKNLDLSEKLVQAKELEAFQAMSAFLIHDLKNTSSSLSLTLRNLPAHFQNPSFREDALRTLSKSVGRVNDIISRLTLLRKEMKLNKTPTNFDEVIESAITSLGKDDGRRISCRLEQLPPLAVDPVQMESVVANLVLNAKEAGGKDNEIRLETRRRNGWAILTVSDKGCGMPPDFVSQSLFKPFKTTKRNGLGIGMFQARAIVEAHGGRIFAESSPGKGSSFRIMLPLKNGENHHT